MTILWLTVIPRQFQNLAFEKFIEKRLHFDRDGVLITTGTIGPGAVARDGTTPNYRKKSQMQEVIKYTTQIP